MFQSTLFSGVFVLSKGVIQQDVNHLGTSRPHGLFRMKVTYESRQCIICTVTEPTEIHYFTQKCQKTTATTTTTIATTTTKNTWRQGRRKTTRQQEHIPSPQKWAVSVSKLPSGCAKGGMQHGKPWHDVSTLQLTGHNYKRHRLEPTF